MDVERELRNSGIMAEECHRHQAAIPQNQIGEIAIDHNAPKHHPQTTNTLENQNQ